MSNPKAPIDRLDRIEQGEQIEYSTEAVFGYDKHEFLLPNTDVPIHPIEATAATRDFIDNLADLKTTFTTKELAYSNNDIGGNGVMDHLLRNILWMCGSWPVSDLRSRDNLSERWVNPNAVHARTHPAVGLKCRCGTPMIRAEDDKDDGAELQHTADKHKDHCKPQWRFRAKARIYDQRASVLIRGLYTGNTARSLSPALGISEDHVGKFCHNIGLDVHKERELSNQRRSNTAALLMQEFSTRIIAKAYDRKKDWIAKKVREDTNVSPKRCYNVRRGSLPEDASVMQEAVEQASADD